MKRCNVTAKKFFQLGSDARDPATMTQLSRCYFFSVGVEKDTEVGMWCLKQAAEAEDSYDTGTYSWYKLHGLNTNVNYLLAFRYSFKVSKKGCGLTVFGQCYEHGITVDRNPKKAFECYAEAVSIVKRLWTVYDGPEDRQGREDLLLMVGGWMLGQL